MATRMMMGRERGEMTRNVGVRVLMCIGAVEVGTCEKRADGARFFNISAIYIGSSSSSSSSDKEFDPLWLPSYLI